MTVDEIKKAVDEGKIVRWSSEIYLVHKVGDSYLITCELNDHTIGLTWLDGVTLNGKEEEFYIEE